jgi:hypothetical protein
VNDVKHQDARCIAAERYMAAMLAGVKRFGGQRYDRSRWRV